MSKDSAESDFKRTLVGADDFVGSVADLVYLGDQHEKRKDIDNDAFSLRMLKFNSGRTKGLWTIE